MEISEIKVRRNGEGVRRSNHGYFEARNWLRTRSRIYWKRENFELWSGGSEGSN